jgi:3-hydroxyacyl-[acyl-carrier-protein] dehydratase
MRYLLVDRILEWQPETAIKGVKNVAMSEDFLEYHFPGNPVMPGVLLLEALVQLAGWLEAASTQFTSWVLLQQVRKCSFYGFVLPGDQVELQLECVPAGAEGLIAYQGMGMVAGKRVLRARFLGERVALGDLEECEAQRRAFRVLTREWKS